MRAAVRQRLAALVLAISAAAPSSSFASAADAPAEQTDAGSIAAIVAAAARRFAIPQRWIFAVMRAESAGDPRAISPAGAVGLMQIMPRTWADLRGRYGLGSDPFNVHDNITAGAAWLKELHDRYGSPGFLAAYNAGPARYEAYIAAGHALPAETRAYVAELAPVLAGKIPLIRLSAPLAWTRAGLFPAAVGAASAEANSAVDMTAAERPQSLFVAASSGGSQP
jgi:soluble lytic murein transglycosylase-like protein